LAVLLLFQPGKVTASEETVAHLEMYAEVLQIMLVAFASDLAEIFGKIQFRVKMPVGIP